MFALLPGSRASELDMHGDLVLQTAAALHASRPDARFLVPLATRPTRDRFEAAIYRLGLRELPLTLLYGHATDALRAADVALVASGTATLEAALARCPHVIFYRVNALTAGIVRRKLLLPWVGLPNILAGKFVVPELLQDDATVENLAQAVGNLYDDTVTRRRLEALFAGFARRWPPIPARLPRTPSRPNCARRASHADRGRSAMLVAGVDEAGRGPLAGPVVAAAVILDPARPIARPARFEAADARPRASGSRSRSARNALAWAVGEADVAEIDALNILQATMLAMRRAVARADDRARTRRWIDGNRCPELACAAHGDRQGRSRRRRDLGGVDPRQDHARRDAGRARCRQYPAYGFAQNKGYGTPEHLAALRGTDPARRIAEASRRSRSRSSILMRRRLRRRLRRAASG